MSDTPTREQVREALECKRILHIGVCDGTDHVGDLLDAARLWLEGPRVDEAMIERAHAESHRTDIPFSECDKFWCMDYIPRMLRAAVEVTDETST